MQAFGVVCFSSSLEGPDKQADSSSALPIPSASQGVRRGGGAGVGGVLSFFFNIFKNQSVVDLQYCVNFRA